MKKLHRILSLLMGLMMILQMLPVSALSEGIDSNSEPATAVVAMPRALAAAQGGTVYYLDKGGNAEGWVTGEKLLVETTSSGGTLVDITNLAADSSINIPEYASFQINIPFNIPTSETETFSGLQTGDKIVYTIPNWVRSLKETGGNLQVGASEAGTWEVVKLENGSQQVLISLLDSYIQSNQFGGNGTINLSGAMEATVSTETETRNVINFLGRQINTVVKKRTAGVKNIDIEKKYTGAENGLSGSNCGEISKAHYTITVLAGARDLTAQRNNVDLEQINIYDEFTTYEKYAFTNEANYQKNNELKKYIKYDNIVATIYDKDGNVVTDRTVVSVDDNKTDAAIQFKVMNRDGTAYSVLHPDDKVVISYDAVIDKEMYEHDPRGPYETHTDTSDKFASGEKSSGSEINAVPIEGANGQNRSWIVRKATNEAKVTTSSLPEGKQDHDTQIVNNETVQHFLDFNKTWLWKNGAPQTNYISKYEVSVNESPVMNIIGWQFSDPIGNDQNGQEIISDVEVKCNGILVDTIPLADLQSENGVASGAAAGSTINEIKYTFPSNGNYRFYYTARFKNPSGENEILCKNSATLTEIGGSGHNDVFGIYESHTVKGATVTKRFDKMDLTTGLIRWQTTIDEGIGTQNGSVYKDFVGWIRKPGNDAANIESDYEDYNAADKKDHTIDLTKIDLEITNGEGDAQTTLVKDTDYTVKILTHDEIGNSRTVADQSNGVKSWNVPYGFQITFLKSFNGPVLLHYNTVADFANVAKEEEFLNKFTYQKDPAKSSFIFYDSVGVSYEQNGTLNKVVDKNQMDSDNPVIKWHLTINEKKYGASSLVLIDTIPADVEFDLLKDLQVRWIANGEKASASTLDDWREEYVGDRGAPNDSWPTKTAIKSDNKYFKATYNESSRELRIEFKDIAYKTVEFNVYTQPTLSVLKDGQTHEFTNVAKLYTNSQTQENTLLQKASASASVKYELAGKDVVYDSTTAPNAKYTIEVNKGGIALNNGKRYTISDSAPDESTLMFKVPETLVVTTKDGKRLTLNEDPYSTLTDDEVRLTAIGDHSFSLDVPDKTALIIKYDAYVPGVLGEVGNLSNTVTLTAEGTELYKKEVVTQKNIEKSNVDINAHNRVRVRKGSTGENAVLLDGAVFEIYDVTNTDHYSLENAIKKGTIVSGEKKENGDYYVGFGLASTYSPIVYTLENFHVYKIVETQAPKGYQTPTIDNAVVGAFVFVTEETPSGKTQAEYLAQINAYRTAGIQVINQNYTEYTFYKSNEPLGRLDVTKKVQFNGAADENATGTFYAALFDGERLFDEVQRIDVVNGQGTTEFVGLEFGKTYILKETDEHGVPVGNDFGYEVTYTGAEVVTTKTAPAATAEIINNLVTGELNISKTIYIGNDIYKTTEPEETAAAGKKFKVTVSTTDDQGKIWYVKDKEGTLISAEKAGETKPTFEIGIKDGVNIKNLPTGIYTVEEVLGEENSEVAIGRLNYVVATSQTIVTATVEKAKTTEVEMINRYTRGSFCVMVTKAWEDENDLDGIRPESITVQLYRGIQNGAMEEKPLVLNYKMVNSETDVKGTDITLNKNNNWTFEATGMSKYDDNGVPYVYEWREVNIPKGYIATYDQIQESPKEDNITYIYRITNTHEVGKTEATVIKVWDDEDNLDGTRPETLTVSLMKRVSGSDEETLVDEYELSEENEWKTTATELPRSENGKEITYRWVETEVPDGYMMTAQVEGTSTTLTNIHRVGSLLIEKIFAGIPAGTDVSRLSFVVTGPDGFEPITITYGEFNQKTSHLITGLAEGEYTVTESNANGLIAKYELSTDSVTTGKAFVSGSNVASIRLVNIYTKTIPSAKGEFTATKSWINPEEGDNLTASLTLIGYTRAEDGTLTEGEKYTKSVTGNGSVKWENMPKFTDEGEPIFYMLREDGVDKDGKVNGYVSTILGNESTGFTVINRKPEVKVESVEVIKEVPTEVIKEVPVPTEVIREVPVPTEVIREVVKEVPVTQERVVYVTPAPDTVSVSVLKVWDDGNNADRLRPNSVTVTLTADGEEIAEETLNAANSWRAEIGGLDRLDENGNVITYAWTERSVRGYTAYYDTMGSTTVITNRHRITTPEPTAMPEPTVTPEPTEEPTQEPDIPTTSVTVRHIWDDNGNAAGMRPGSITATVSDGTVVVLTEANGWTVTLDNMPATTAEGTPITYTWREKEALGYTLTSVITDGNVTTFINTYRSAIVPPDNRRVPGKPMLVINDYDTPLGIEVMINHVGDCFE